MSFLPRPWTLSDSYPQNSYPALYIQAYFDYLLMNIGNIILMISGFSFLGIGVQPNITEWGMMPA